MSLRRTLDVMAATVGRATSVPLSASCLVNRAELLSLVERAKAELPAELDEAAALLVAHQEVIADAERDRDQMIADARAQVEDLLAESAVVVAAQARSEQILAAARAEAARLLRQADEYCDVKLAGFETDLERLTAQVRRGRSRLRERSELHTAEITAVNAAEAENAAQDGHVYPEDAHVDEGAYEGAYEDAYGQPYAGEAPPSEELVRSEESEEPAETEDSAETDEAADRGESAGPEGQADRPLPAQVGPGRVIDLTAVEEERSPAGRSGR